MAEKGSNGFNAADRWVTEIEKHQQTKVSIMMKAVADCGTIEKMIKDAKKAAKNEGISLKLLNAALKERDLLRKVVKNREAFDDDDADDFEMLIESLTPVKDLPLFGAAIEGAEQKKAEKVKAKAAAKGKELDDLDEDFDAADPAKEQVTNNVTRIGKGIKPLPH